MRGLSPDLVERFRVDLAELIDPLHLRLGLAVSGGGDSLALLLLAHAALPGRVSAATVDHGLRVEARDEALFVQDVCAELGVPHTILTPAAPITGSVQSAARAARYAALERWASETGCDWIATAHHVDDQAETLLMRLNRGSGVAGLAGVRVMNGRVIRPLLRWRRQELADILAGCGLKAVDDPSNHDLDFDRVRVRAGLADAGWLNVTHIAHSAALLAEANTALDWATDQLIKDRLTLGIGTARLDPSLLPRELRRRLTLIALRHVDSELEPRGAAIVALIEALGRGETRTLGKVLIKGGARWRFSIATPRQKN
jgi:tRNA(Ile)-lysidine synthase